MSHRPSKPEQSKPLGLGDWVQAVLKVQGTEGGKVVTCADVGDVGHVLDLEDPEYPTVYFERLGQVSSVELSEIHRLCGPDFGSLPIRPIQENK